MGEKKEKIQDNIDRLLLVEGKDECNFFEFFIKEHLFKQNNLANAPLIQIINVGGKDQFISKFKILSGDDNFGKIIRFGFIRDAEEDPRGAFDSIKKVLTDYKLPVPPNIGGIKKTSELQTGIFIMPNNSEKGALENLVIETVKNKKEYKCVNEFIKCIPKYKSPNFENRIAKASVLAYLASQKKIVNSLGLGASKNYWNFNHDSLTQLKSFIINLYS